MEKIIKTISSTFNLDVFSTMIKAKRGWNNQGVRECAKEIGISPATLSRLENKGFPDLISCKKVCNWLNVDIDYFFDLIK